MIAYSYTVQVGRQIIYEGPVEKNALELMAKATKSMNGDKAFYRVVHNDRTKFDGKYGNPARRVFYDTCEVLEQRGHKTDTVRFEIHEGDRSVSLTVRPFQERLLGGQAQRSRGSQFGD